MPEVAKILEAIREANNLSLRKFAQVIGMDPSNYSRLRNGAPVSIKRCKELIKRLNIECSNARRKLMLAASYDQLELHNTHIKQNLTFDVWCDLMEWVEHDKPVQVNYLLNQVSPGISKSLTDDLNVRLIIK